MRYFYVIVRLSAPNRSNGVLYLTRNDLQKEDDKNVFNLVVVDLC